MISRKSIIFLIFILSINFLFAGAFAGSKPSLAAESSIIPFQLSLSSKPMLHLGSVQESSSIRPIGGMQIQPTANLLLGGVLSPWKIDNDLSIYYHFLVGYIPDWKFFKISSNLIQIGMHRHRFSDTGDLRWFSFSVMESAKLGNLKMNVCWNRLFTQKWERNTVFLSTDFKIFKGFYLRPGAIAKFTPSLDFSPFLFGSISL